MGLYAVQCANEKISNHEGKLYMDQMSNEQKPPDSDRVRRWRLDGDLTDRAVSLFNLINARVSSNIALRFFASSMAESRESWSLLGESEFLEELLGERLHSHSVVSIAESVHGDRS